MIGAGRSQRRSRFSLLMLDHGELYLEDHASHFHPSQAQAPRLLEAGAAPTLVELQIALLSTPP